mmetsp:Transcript_44662/g.105948  ORF Transcript_44662/g.105948 Transcript_44662/m.105948 type:complete len:507 (+) Transcript_44662:1-1521(+)
MMFLWCGWYGFNCGSTKGLSSVEDANTVSVAFISTTMSAASAGVTVSIGSLVRTRGNSIEVLRLTSAILGGLVAITASCDAVTATSACCIGVVSGPLVYGCSLLLHRYGIDDVCDAIPVHGAAGAWGTIAVGLFHQQKGFLTTGSLELLQVQVLGTVVIACWGAIASSLYLMVLTRLLRIRSSPLEEAIGLDEKLGYSAYVRASEEAKAKGELRNVLEAFGHSLPQAAAALRSLRFVPHLTLTPQASDGKLRGEIEDIVHHMSLRDATSPEWEFFAFLSHHKKDGGEVARVLLDELRYFLEHVARQRAAEKRDQEEWCSHASNVSGRFQSNALVFLDSNNLRELSTLLPKVEKSANFVLLLTRSVLRRPWCIAEVTRAFAAGRKIICVNVEWPDKHQDGRAFRMPQDLEDAITRVTPVELHEPQDSSVGSAPLSPLQRLRNGRHRRTSQARDPGNSLSSFVQPDVMDLEDKNSSLESIESSNVSEVPSETSIVEERNPGEWTLLET